HVAPLYTVAPHICRNYRRLIFYFNFRVRTAETALCVEANLFGALCGAYDCKRFAEVSIGGVAVVALFVIGARTAEREKFAALYVHLDFAAHERLPHAV